MTQISLYQYLKRLFTELDAISISRRTAREAMTYAYLDQILNDHSFKDEGTPDKDITPDENKRLKLDDKIKFGSHKPTTGENIVYQLTEDQKKKLQEVFALKIISIRARNTTPPETMAEYEAYYHEQYDFHGYFSDPNYKEEKHDYINAINNSPTSISLRPKYPHERITGSTEYSFVYNGPDAKNAAQDHYAEYWYDNTINLPIKQRVCRKDEFLALLEEISKDYDIATKGINPDDITELKDLLRNDRTPQVYPIPETVDYIDIPETYIKRKSTNTYRIQKNIYRIQMSPATFASVQGYLNRIFYSNVGGDTATLIHGLSADFIVQRNRDRNEHIIKALERELEKARNSSDKQVVENLYINQLPIIISLLSFDPTNLQPSSLVELYGGYIINTDENKNSLNNVVKAFKDAKVPLDVFTSNIFIPIPKPEPPTINGTFDRKDAKAVREYEEKLFDIAVATHSQSLSDNTKSANIVDRDFDRKRRNKAYWFEKMKWTDKQDEQIIQTKEPVDEYYKDVYQQYLKFQKKRKLITNAAAATQTTVNSLVQRIPGTKFLSELNIARVIDKYQPGSDGKILTRETEVFAAALEKFGAGVTLSVIVLFAHSLLKGLGVKTFLTVPKIFFINSVALPVLAIIVTYAIRLYKAYKSTHEIVTSVFYSNREDTNDLFTKYQSQLAAEQAKDIADQDHALINRLTRVLEHISLYTSTNKELFNDHYTRLQNPLRISYGDERNEMAKGTYDPNNTTHDDTLAADANNKEILEKYKGAPVDLLENNIADILGGEEPQWRGPQLTRGM